MKIIFVVDSISSIQQKINMIRSRFGDNILFVVKAPLADLFKTYGYQCNAVYKNRLALTIHVLLKKSEIDDVLVYYSSFNVDNALLNKFTSKIKNDKITNVMPIYNSFESMCNSAYNVYVKSIFKINDSMASPKLQHIPAVFMTELLESHFANRLFEPPKQLVENVYIEDKKISDSAKIKSSFSKLNIIFLISLLAITMALIIGLAFIKVGFVFVLIFVLLYILDIILFLIFQCKNYLDSRLLK